MQDIQELIEKLLPGALGSTGALFWLKGGWKRKLGLWIFGIIFAYYVGGFVAKLASAPETVTGLIIGLFCMTIIDRLFDAIQRFDFADLFNRVINKFIGRG